MLRSCALAAVVWTALLFGCAQPADPPPGPVDGSEAFALTCAHCHASGLPGIPRAGMAEDWNARDTQDLDVLVDRVIAGHGNMPPLGSCAWCSEAELRAAIRLMAVGSDVGEVTP